LGSVYTSDTAFNAKVSYDIVAGIPLEPTATVATKITTTSPQGIALNPNNADDLIMFAGFSGSNKRTANATSASPTFSNLGTVSTPQVASYDGIIDRNDPNIIVVGTSSGVFITEDGGIDWTNASTGFEGTPITMVRQSWRTFDEGNGRPGEIYVGTYGRGIWASESYLGLEEQASQADPLNNMLLYPNPANSACHVVYDLAQSGDVSIAIYNLAGVLMNHKLFNNQSAGGKKVSIDINDLPRGTYIVQLTSSGQKLSKKLLKL
jgi:hypothetical protein